MYRLMRLALILGASLGWFVSCAREGNDGRRKPMQPIVSDGKPLRGSKQDRVVRDPSFG